MISNMYNNFKFFIIIVVITMMFISCNKSELSNADYAVIPLPQKTDSVAGEPFVLTKSTIITYPKGNADLERVAIFLSDYIKFSTGKSLSVSDIQRDTDAILLDCDLQNDNKEAYSLNVTDNCIRINGSSSAGTFYGTQTLRKSIAADSEGKDILFPAVKIEDYPRFRYRGMHLDVGRHIFPVEFIKEYINILALHNMNRFHWHLTDDQGWRIEIKKYPELAEKGSIRKHTVIGRNSGEFDNKPYGGFYTQDEAREIVAYAQERFITVIPEIDLPGHMLGALTAYPQFGCTGGPYEVIGEWGVFDDVLCAGNENIYPFLENVFSEIIDIFPSEYIHIGGDECPKVRWKECPKCQSKIRELGLKSDKEHSVEDRLQSYVISRVEKFLNSKGRQIIGWDEILEGGLAPNATVMSWRGMEGAVVAAKSGHDAIMTPTSHMYFDYYQTTDVDNVPLAIGGYTPLDKTYSFEPIPSYLNDKEAQHIIGVQANLWTEYIPTTQQVEYMILPRIDALSEVQWTSPEMKNYTLFVNRLSKMLKYYDKKEYNYAKTVFDIDTEIENDTIKSGLKVSLSTIDNAPIYYTLDGSQPDEKSNRYTDTLFFKESTKIKALAIRSGIKSSIYNEYFQINKATAKPIIINQMPHSSYTFGGISSLLNGISGNRKNYKDGSWLGFSKGDIEMVIDLKDNLKISQLEFNTYICTGDWIFGAKSFTVSVSNDGKNYKTVSEERYKDIDKHIERIELNKSRFAPVTTRYVKLKITKTNKMPDWHPGANKSAFIFIDEIKID